MNQILVTVALLAQQGSTSTLIPDSPSPAFANKPRVEGHVINSLSGDPVPKVTVILRAHDQEHALSYADETDGNGHFSIDHVEPGEYEVVADRSGFVAKYKGATGAPSPALTVERDHPIDDIAIRMTPLGVIVGRVLDMDGDPIRGANVSALAYVYNAGHKELTNVEQVTSGDNGEFRLFGLRAGTFYLKATAPQSPSNTNLQTLATATYYPGTNDESHAALVVLGAGAQLQGFDIRLQSTAVYTIRFSFPEDRVPGRGFTAFLLQNQSDSQPGFSTIFDNKLVFLGVPPGSYDAVFIAYGPDQTVYAIEHVEVTSGDVNGGALTLLPGTTVSGTVRVEGGAFNDLTKLRINLESQFQTSVPNPMTGTRSVEVKADGSFLLKDAPPQPYKIAINRITGVYLKSARMGDKLLVDRRIDLASKIEPLTVVLGADVGVVEGSVKNASGDPVARARVNVIAYGDDADRPDLNRFGFSDDKGEFTIKDVPPGDYKVFAWEDVPVGAPQDPEFRKPFEKQAAELRMPPNGHEKVSVMAIAADAAMSGRTTTDQ